MVLQYSLGLNFGTKVSHNTNQQLPAEPGHMKRTPGNGWNHSLLMIADLYIKFWGLQENKNVKQR